MLLLHLFTVCSLVTQSLCILLDQGSQTTHIYVSPTGSDSNTGLDIHHPLKTLEKAKSKLDQPGIRGDTIYVELLRGYYDLTSTLHFTHKYTAPVTFRSYSGQEVHVGYIDITSVNNTHGTTFTHGSSEDGRWTHEKEPWAWGYWYFSWADDAVKINNINNKNHQITLSTKTRYGLRVGHYNDAKMPLFPIQGGYFRVINMLSELDEPGEYYIDRSTGILYVWPNTQHGTLSFSDIIYASMISDCIVLDDGVTNVHFEDFTLEACRRFGVNISSGSDIGLKNMEIKNTGAYGVYCHGDCRNVTVSRCEIHDTCGGISMAGGVRTSLTASGDVIEDNHVWQFSRVGAVGYHAISLSGVGTSVRYNHLHDGQYTGIKWSGNDHVMEYNHIHHMCVNTSDCGALHAGRDWSMRGNVIRYNHIHHTLRFVPGAEVRGVMLDDEFSSVTIEHNVFYENEDHTNIGGGRDNIIRYNVYYNATGHSIRLDGRGLNHASHALLTSRLNAMPYKSPLWVSKYPLLANISNPGEPAGHEIYENIFYNKGDIPTVYYVTGRLEKARFFDVRDNHRAASTTDFWSPDDADFRVRCAAAEWANAINFPQPIDVNHVGPRFPTGPTYMQKPRTTIKSPTHPAACAGTAAPATKIPRTPYYSDGSGPNTVYPNIPKQGCWLIVSGCSVLHNTTTPYRDTWGEQHAQTDVKEENCLKRAAEEWRKCGSPAHGTVKAVFGPTGAMTIASRHCYFADYGCPAHGGSHTGYLHVDMYGEQHGALTDENKCLSRAAGEWSYCGSDVDHPVSSIYGPTGAIRHAGGGCWIKISACPSDTKLTGFFYDAWGATNLNTDYERDECLARAGYYWKHCGSHHDQAVTAYFKPKAVSKTVS